jgi:hypothetical protein
MNEAEVGIEEVKVKDALWPAAERELRPTLPVEQLDGAAAFLAAENGDESLGDAALANGVLNELFFAVSTLQVE